jgi:hypothetical protein
MHSDTYPVVYGVPFKMVLPTTGRLYHSYMVLQEQLDLVNYIKYWDSFQFYEGGLVSRI